MTTKTTPKPEDTGIYWQGKVEAAEARLAEAQQHRAALREAIVNGDESVTPQDLGEADRGIEFCELALEGARRAVTAFHERMAREAWDRLKGDYYAATSPHTEAEVKSVLDGIAAEAREEIAGIMEELDKALEPGRRHNAAVRAMREYLKDGTSYRDPSIQGAGSEVNLEKLREEAILAIVPAEWVECIRRDSRPSHTFLTTRGLVL